MGKLREPEGWEPKYQAPIRNWYRSQYVSGLEGLMCHELESIPTIQKVVRIFDPQLMVELGTGAGGFTLVLHESKRTCLLYSFDLYPISNPQAKIKKFLRRHGKPEDYQRKFLTDGFDDRYVTFIVEDIIEEPSSYLIDLLRRPERKLLYCDNGNKIFEVNTYAPFLKPGDMLGVHDWASGDSIDYEKGGIANTLEPFVDHAANNWFMENRLRTRFFLRM